MTACRRCEIQLVTIRSMYKHLDKAWRKRFRREHWCPSCPDSTWQPQPHLPRDPEETR